MHPDLAAVVEAERSLLDPRIRRDPLALARLIHEDFREFGASGRVYDRRSIVEALRASGDPAGEALDLRATRLGPDAVLVTYRTDAPPSSRSSVWVREHAGPWRVLHHQGTASS